jgi:hypothetical protein
MTVRLELHREARKERQRLPTPVALEYAVVEEAIMVDPYAPAFVHKREVGWGRRTVLVAEYRGLGTIYRMAWEVIDAAHVYIWAYGPHQGFYERLSRRARQ